MINEKWSPIPGFEGLYEASSLGRIRSLARPRVPETRVIEGRVTRYGGQGRIGTPYRSVSLCREAEKPRNLRVHQLVALAFLGEPEPGQQVRHLDGDSLNNTLSNLTYGTASENALDTVLAGNHHQASKTHCVKGHLFTEENVRRITVHTGRTWRRCRTCERTSTPAY